MLANPIKENSIYRIYILSRVQAIFCRLCGPTVTRLPGVNPGGGHRLISAHEHKLVSERVGERKTKPIHAYAPTAAAKTV
jgi:hypothetical protein